jgi:hypothetical protein
MWFWIVYIVSVILAYLGFRQITDKKILEADGIKLIDFIIFFIAVLTPYFNSVVAIIVIVVNIFEVIGRINNSPLLLGKIIKKIMFFK